MPELGKGNFSFAIWVKLGDKSDRPTGDLLCRYAPKTRRGYHITLKSSPIVVFEHTIC
jgi:hypothetical protein